VGTFDEHPWGDSASAITVDAGVTAISVSNDGGNNLDGNPGGHWGC
jgi:hypothetical protein